MNEWMDRYMEEEGRQWNRGGASMVKWGLWKERSISLTERSTYLTAEALRSLQTP